MVSAKTIEHRKAVLRAKGVPERFVEALATRKAGGLGGILGALALYAGVYGAGGLELTYHLDPTPWVRQWLYGGISQGLFFSPGGIFAFFPMFFMVAPLLILMFGGLALWAALFPERVRPWPAYSAMAAALRTLGRNRTLKTTQPSPRYRQLGHLTSEVAFLEALVREQPVQLAKTTMWMLVILAILPLLPAALAARDYVRITEQAVEMHHAWGTRIVAIKDIRRVETVCVDSGKASGFHYTLVLPVQRLELYPTPSFSELSDRRQVLVHLKSMDAFLRSRKVPDLAMGTNGQSRAQYNHCVSAWRVRMKMADLNFPALLPTS